MRKSLKDQLLHFRMLKLGWDSYGALKINPLIIDECQKFIDRIPENLIQYTMVFPVSSGTIQIEINKGNKELELEFVSTTTIEYLQWGPTLIKPEKYIVPETPSIEDSVLIADEKKIQSLLSWIAEE